MKKLIPDSAMLIPGGATCAFQGEIFAVYQWEQALFDGSTDTFEMLKRPDTTSVICIVDDRVIVLDEEQPGNGPRRNFPGGRIDATDTDVIAAAKREVLEETGYSFDHWRLVLVQQPIRKMEWFIYYLVAWGVTGQQETAHEAGEKITAELVDFAGLIQLTGQRTGSAYELAELFVANGVDTIDKLTTLPEYAGMAVDR